MLSCFPKKYQNKLGLIETQEAIKFVKDTFEAKLAESLQLIRVSAPLFVEANTGLNDNLNGVEMPVKFMFPALNKELEIVQSLAKWKRMALQKYNIATGHGIYTDMNAIRPFENLDNIHSLYVDQWDWEMAITKKERNLAFLKSVVCKIVKTLAETNRLLKEKFPVLSFPLEEGVFFITTEELLQMYPHLTPRQRENEICKLKKTVFIIGIGDNLSNGEPHDLRAPDYDDWSLNGDILLWNPVLSIGFEVSSMGIRVDSQSLEKQLIAKNNTERLQLPFHKNIMDGQYPLSIGGGIGQSRVCQLLLEKLHIGEVQVSVWNEEDIKKLKQIGANVL